ncbi:MAG: hypothetical protein EPN88_16395 [Bacteroidetes bacterium]|nr:MAG: hypothetical protein EPN88_16395 [Bacteroidota bacterium]
MKCLNRIEIQEFIDKEVDAAIEIEIQSHLKNCEQCTSLYLQANEARDVINNLLSQVKFTNETNSIPEFKIPISKNKKNISYRFIAVVAAASLIGFIFLFRFDRKPVTEKIPEAEIIMYEYLNGQDLNKLWHDKSQILIIQDEKGNVIQTTITY